MKNFASILILISLAFYTVNAAKCEDDILAKINAGTVCPANDNACTTALNTFFVCFSNCGNTNTSDSAIKSCVKSNCSNITNDTVKAFYNSILACFDSVLLFSVLLVFIALLL